MKQTLTEQMESILSWAENTPDELFDGLQSDCKLTETVGFSGTIADAVDLAGYLDRQKKEIESQLNELKDQIKTYAEKNGVKEIHGTEATAKISGTTKTEIPFIPALRYIREHGLNIDGVFRVSVTEFKKLVGDTGLQEVGATIEKIEYNSVSFK